mmetsp:Transcript_2639/g.9367  ORF Transcript_2639/g.9367 Transcript_2639/m.9367 type:complete len:292 (-) Transcript_2639:1202-2077(-)
MARFSSSSFFALRASRSTTASCSSAFVFISVWAARSCATWALSSAWDARASRSCCRVASYVALTLRRLSLLLASWSVRFLTTASFWPASCSSCWTFSSRTAARCCSSWASFLRRPSCILPWMRSDISCALASSFSPSCFVSRAFCSCIFLSSSPISSISAISSSSASVPSFFSCSPFSFAHSAVSALTCFSCDSTRRWSSARLRLLGFCARATVMWCEIELRSSVIRESDSCTESISCWIFFSSSRCTRRVFSRSSRVLSSSCCIAVRSCCSCVCACFRSLCSVLYRARSS